MKNVQCYSIWGLWAVSSMLCCAECLLSRWCSAAEWCRHGRGHSERLCSLRSREKARIRGKIAQTKVSKFKQDRFSARSLALSLPPTTSKLLLLKNDVSLPYYGHASSGRVVDGKWYPLLGTCTLEMCCRCHLILCPCGTQ